MKRGQSQEICKTRAPANVRAPLTFFWLSEQSLSCSAEFSTQLETKSILTITFVMASIFFPYPPNVLYLLLSSAYLITAEMTVVYPVSILLLLNQRTTI